MEVNWVEQKAGLLVEMKVEWWVDWMALMKVVH